MKDFGMAVTIAFMIFFIALIYMSFVQSLSGRLKEVACEREHDVYSCVRVYVPDGRESE